MFQVTMLQAGLVFGSCTVLLILGPDFLELALLSFLFSILNHVFHEGVLQLFCFRQPSIDILMFIFDFGGYFFLVISDFVDLLSDLQILLKLNLLLLSQPLLLLFLHLPIPFLLVSLPL